MGVTLGASARRPDWLTKLNEFIRGIRADDIHFSWGGYDCVCFALRAISVQHDIDLVAKLDYKYSTLIGAVRTLKKHGCSSPEEAARKLMGEPVHIAMAQFGDIVALDTASVGMSGEGSNLGMSLGVCFGSSSYFMSDDGLVTVPTDKCSEVFYHG